MALGKTKFDELTINNKKNVLPESHVLLDAVHPVLEFHPGGVHVGDHAADVTDDGGEDEHARQEINHDEQILGICFRLRRLANCRQGQS
jgi:hypothetical protein